MKPEEIAGMIVLLLFGTFIGCVVVLPVLLWIFFGGH